MYGVSFSKDWTDPAGSEFILFKKKISSSYELLSNNSLFGGQL